MFERPPRHPYGQHTTNSQFLQLTTANGIDSSGPIQDLPQLLTLKREVEEMLQLVNGTREYNPMQYFVPAALTAPGIGPTGPLMLPLSLSPAERRPDEKGRVSVA